MITTFRGRPSASRRVLLLAGIAPVVLIGTAAQAQNASPPPSQVKPSATLQEVVVTVARRSQNLQKVPTAVQVVSGAKIASQGLTNIAQIVADVPSVQATTQPAGFSIDVRGQGGDLPSGQSQGSVALETDGVYNVLSIGTVLGFFDLDNLEVLPGPQSTQYGPDADGGVVDVNTKNPEIGKTSGYATLTVGNYNLVRLEAAQDIPLNDVLAARIAATAVNGSSYFTPATTNNVGQGVRAKLLYQPNDAFSAKLSYELDHEAGTGEGFEGVGGPPTLGNTVGIPVRGGVPAGPVTAAGYAQYPGGSINNYKNPWALGQYTIGNGPSFANSQARLYQNEVSLGLNYQISDQIQADELASFIDIVGSGQDCSQQGYTFGDVGIPASAMSCENVLPFDPYHSYSSETRLHNPSGTPLQWNLGFYHWSYTYSSRAANQLPKSQGFTRTTTNAPFAQVTYPVLQTLRLIAGLRESFDERIRNQSSFGPNTGGPPGGSILPDSYLHLSHFDYTAGAEFDLTPTSMEYAKVSTGYRPGSLNYDGTLGKNVLQPNEVNTAFEFGTKNRLLDNTLQLNADIFYYIQKGYQFGDGYNGFYASDGTFCTNGVTDPACDVAPLSLNAHAVGLETQARYNVTPNDQLSLNATAMNATFDNKQTGCRALGLTAAQLASGLCYAGYNNNAIDNGAPLFFAISNGQQPHSPHFATTANYSHTFEIAQGSLRLGGEVFYSTGFFTHPVESPYSYQPSYFQEGLTADFTPTVGKWDLSGYAHNLSNYAVKQSSLPTTTIGDPRTFGFNFLYRW